MEEKGLVGKHNTAAGHGVVGGRNLSLRRSLNRKEATSLLQEGHPKNPPSKHTRHQTHLTGAPHHPTSSDSFYLPMLQNYGTQVPPLPSSKASANYATATDDHLETLF